MNVTNASVVVSPVIPAQPQSPNGGWLDAFPLRSFLELGAYREAAGSARGHARNVLREWGLGHLEDPVVLTLSELLTNAVAATGAATWDAGLPPVRVWLLGGSSASGDGAVLLLVWDAVAEVPAEPGLAGELAESGRGLFIARKYSTRLDFYRPPWEHGGKIARALIDRPAPPEDLVTGFHLAEPLPGDCWPRP